MAATSDVETRRRKILDAATDLFYSAGFSGVGMDAIGARAGYSGPAIYRHFSGKDEILATLFDEAIDGLILVTGPPLEDPWAELGQLVEGHTSFVLEQRTLAGVKIREERSLAGPSRRRLRDRERRYVDRWLSCVARCRPDLAADAQISAGHAALGMVNSIASWPADALKEPSLPRLLVSIVVHGLEGASAPPAA